MLFKLLAFSGLLLFVMCSRTPAPQEALPNRKPPEQAPLSSPGEASSPQTEHLSARINQESILRELELPRDTPVFWGKSPLVWNDFPEILPVILFPKASPGRFPFPDPVTPGTAYLIFLKKTDSPVAGSPIDILSFPARPLRGALLPENILIRTGKLLSSSGAEAVRIFSVRGKTLRGDSFLKIFRLRPTPKQLQELEAPLILSLSGKENFVLRFTHTLDQDPDPDDSPASIRIEDTEHVLLKTLRWDPRSEQFLSSEGTPVSSGETTKDQAAPAPLVRRLSRLWYPDSSSAHHRPAPRKFIQFSFSRKRIFIMDGTAIQSYKWLWEHTSGRVVEILGKDLYSKRQLRLHVRFLSENKINLTSFSPHILSGSGIYYRLRSDSGQTFPPFFSPKNLPELSGKFKGEKETLSFDGSFFHLRREGEDPGEGIWTLRSPEGRLILQLGFINAYKQIYKQETYAVLYTEPFKGENQKTFRLQMRPVMIRQNGTLRTLSPKKVILLEKVILNRTKAEKKERARKKG